MLKYFAILPLLLAFLFNYSSTGEPETPSYMLSEQLAMNANVAREKADRQRIISNLVTYLERKWKRPRSDIQSIVDLSFSLTSNGLYKPLSSTTAWPKPEDVLAVIQVESGFNKTARDSVSGSVGLMQINTDDHKINPDKLTKPAVSITYGLALMKKYHREMASESRALVAYNQGPISAALTCGRRKFCETPYTIKVAMAKREIQRHLN